MEWPTTTIIFLYVFILSNKYLQQINTSLHSVLIDAQCPDLEFRANQYRYQLSLSENFQLPTTSTVQDDFQPFENC